MESRPGISASIALIVVVLIIAAAFYIEIPMVSSSSSTLTAVGGGSTSSSTGTASTSTPGGSSGTLSFSTPQPFIVAPNEGETVSLKLSAIGTVSGNYTFSATGLPTGVTATFKPSSVNLPAQLQSPVTVTLSATTGATVVNATVNVMATAGSSVFTQPFTLMSVPALVLIQGNAFSPSSLTVASGAKVYWLNLDAAGGEVGVTTGHDVTAVDKSFSSGTGNLQQYAIYGHTFATAGTVPYESAAQPSMTAQITVTG